MRPTELFDGCVNHVRPTELSVSEEAVGLWPSAALCMKKLGVFNQTIEWLMLQFEFLFHLDHSSKEIMNTLLKSTTEPKLTFWGRGYIKGS